jgi:alpha-tubulin suppressor-like RCC1 family protein
VFVDSGPNYAVAIREDGSAVAWGHNEYGRCDVPDRNDFLSVACGFGHCLAIVVPEPSCLALLLSSSAVLLRRRRNINEGE